MRSSAAIRGVAFSAFAAISAATTGCTHNYYYTGVPNCVPAGQAVSTQVGPVCEVPSAQGTVVTSGGTTSGDVIVAKPSSPLSAFGLNPQKVVISQPASGPAPNRGLGRLGNWHRPDPESLASIRTEGGLSDETVQK